MQLSLKLKETSRCSSNSGGKSLGEDCIRISNFQVGSVKKGRILILDSNYQPYGMEAVKRSKGVVKGVKSEGSSGVGGAPSMVLGHDNFFKKSVLQLIVVLHMASSMMAFMKIQDLLIVKACRVNLGYGEDICSGVEARSESQKDEGEAVQQLVASAMMWRSVLENLFPIALVCLVGAWSDKYGRKLPMIAVLSAFVFQHGLLALIADDRGWFGAWSVSILSSLFVSLAGNNACFGMSVFSHVSDTTRKDQLSSATAITGSAFFLGVTVGLGLSGLLSAWQLSFVKVFGIAAVMELTGLILLLLMIDNNPRDREAYDRLSSRELLVEVFKVEHIKDAVYTVVKPRRGSNRLMLWCLLLSHALVLAPLFGEGVVTYLFSRKQFNWDASAFSTFMTYKTIVGFIGNFVSMAVLSESLKLSDPAVGIISCGSQLVASVIFAFATSTFVMYLVPVIGIFMGAITSVARSVIFTIVPGNETGKINAFIGSLESLTPLLVTPAYSMMYAATSPTLEGGFFLLSAAFMVPPILVYAWILTMPEKRD